MLQKKGWVGKKNRPLKRLSNVEARREKGLCFKCNKKIFASHRCKTKENIELILFIASEDYDLEDGEQEIEKEEGVENASSLRTMKIKERSKEGELWCWLTMEPHTTSYIRS